MSGDDNITIDNDRNIIKSDETAEEKLAKARKRSRFSKMNLSFIRGPSDTRESLNYSERRRLSFLIAKQQNYEETVDTLQTDEDLSNCITCHLDTLNLLDNMSLFALFTKVLFFFCFYFVFIGFFGTQSGFIKINCFVFVFFFG